MNRHLLALGTALAAFLSSFDACAQAASSEAATQLAPLRRADETLSVTGRDGRVQALRVALHEWTLVAGRDIPRFPADGDLLVHLRAGRVTTTIDGQSTARNEGEFWLVPAGKAMAVRVTTEMATIETTSVSRP
jgi:quercetin dioxygenase-like cupin family protein